MLLSVVPGTTVFLEILGPVCARLAIRATDQLRR